MSEFKKFSSIESFAHAYRGQDYFDNKAVVTYGAKIKLHGTNAGVRVTPEGNVFAQSRSRDITIDTDNCGFAAWVALTHDAWAFPPEDNDKGDIVFFGEWAGKGIQKGDAVCQLDDKYFFVFAIYDAAIDYYIVDPDRIEAMVPDLDQVVVLPWDIVWTDPIDFNDAEACDKFATMLSNGVKDIGDQDPFIHGIFGISGPGEGWVVSPMFDPDGGKLEDGAVSAWWYNHMTFKVKTEAHAVQKAKVSKDIQVPEGVPEFVEMFVTQARCEQGLNEIGPYAAKESTADFLKWLGQDIKKESVQELADAGLEWKDVSKHVTYAALKWWLAECEKIE